MGENGKNDDKNDKNGKKILALGFNNFYCRKKFDRIKPLYLLYPVRVCFLYKKTKILIVTFFNLELI